MGWILSGAARVSTSLCCFFRSPVYTYWVLSILRNYLGSLCWFICFSKSLHLPVIPIVWGAKKTEKVNSVVCWRSLSESSWCDLQVIFSELAEFNWSSHHFLLLNHCILETSLLVSIKWRVSGQSSYLVISPSQKWQKWLKKEFGENHLL